MHVCTWNGQDYPHSMRHLLAPALLALVLTGCGGSGESKQDEPVKTAAPAVDLSAAVDACTSKVETELESVGDPSDPLPAETVMRLGDGGKSLDVSPLQAAEFLVKPSAEAAMCVLRETDAPDSVVAEVGQTSGIDGRQDASWDGVALSYSYDSRTGFSGVFTAN